MIESLQPALLNQVDTARRLLMSVPKESGEWRPTAPLGSRPLLSVHELARHLVDCVAGFCAVLYAVRPGALAHFLNLKSLAETTGTALQAADNLEILRARIVEGFSLLDDRDLSAILPTVFRADGESVLTLLLKNFEHFAHHKAQLFLYLRLVGVEVDTADLYGVPVPAP
ncbi:MAG: DinB family protein [Acidobacteria bacterium]|nr:DinB family protein [Acidobacteriota bacterium]